MSHAPCRIQELNQGLPHTHGPMAGALYQTELMRHAASLAQPSGEGREQAGQSRGYTVRHRVA